MKKILIIDKDRKNCSIVEKQLEGIGLELITVNGFETLKNVADKMKEISVIITEIIFDDADVQEYVRFLKENFDDVPVIVMTKQDSFELEKEVRSMGVYSYFAKPVEMNEMKKMILSLVEKNKPRFL